ncbi:MAG: zinc ABC transporter substrate-binding protein [Planctomycetaceae bacterium]|nr:zinc ABC transporter substrate-binding protein [Planctomycetaceae bacterium]
MSRPEIRHQNKLSVAVSIEPQAFFVRKIAAYPNVENAYHVDIETLVPPGREPETYAPSPEKIRKLAQCRVFFSIGFPAEQNLLPRLKSQAPHLRVVDVLEGLKLHEDHHHHAGHAAHAHGGADPHIWMSPALVKEQAGVIRDTLIGIDPAGKEDYIANCEKFLVELTDLQKKVHEKLDPLAGKTIYVYHPSYAYFCEEFGLVQRAIEVEGKSPSPREIADWIKTFKADHVRAVIIQPEFNQSAARMIAEQTAAELIEHSPLESEYYISVLRLADSISRMYGQK